MNVSFVLKRLKLDGRWVISFLSIPPQTHAHIHTIILFFHFANTHTHTHTFLIILDSAGGPALCDRSMYIRATVSAVITIHYIKRRVLYHTVASLPLSLSSSFSSSHCYKLLMRHYCAAEAAALVIYVSQLFMHGFICSLIWIHWEIKHMRRFGSSIIPHTALTPHCHVSLTENMQRFTKQRELLWVKTDKYRGLNFIQDHISKWSVLLSQAHAKVSNTIHLY